MVQHASAKLTFKDVWTFPEEVEKRIATFVNGHPGKWLHAPVGVSKIGKGYFNNGVDMTTLDINRDVSPDVTGDIFKLPFARGSFRGCISDPIWYTEDKHKTIGLSYPDRRYLSYAIRDVLEPGGRWLFNGLWNPVVKGLRIDHIECPMQRFSSFRNLSLLFYLTRVNEELVP